jgi:phage tail sheath protein FI
MIKHGVSFNITDTKMLAPIASDINLIFAVGTAPINLAEDINNVNKIKLCNSYDEAIKYFGSSSDFENYTLSEVIDCEFSQFNAAPIVLVNVLDPTKHKATSSESATIVNNQATLTADGIILSSVVVKVATKEMKLATDYTLEFNNAGKVVIKILSGSAIKSSDTIDVAFDKLDPSKVTADDLVGGYDTATGSYTGLYLVDQVFPQVRKVPMQIICPKFSKNSQVEAVMKVKASKVSGLFGACAVVDLDDSSFGSYADAPAKKVQDNYTSSYEDVCLGTVGLGDKKYNLSTQFACLTQRIAGLNNAPHVSASNKPLQMDSYFINGRQVNLEQSQANYLNDNGIITALNFLQWTAWGNRTGGYPASSDPVKCFSQQRNLFNWIGNTLILTYWSKVDDPTNRALVDSVVTSVNIWLNGLAAKNILLGGYCEFSKNDNPITDLMAGIVRFRLYLAGPIPAEYIEFVLEFDTNLLANIGG